MRLGSVLGVMMLSPVVLAPYQPVCKADMEFVSISDPGFIGDMGKYEVTNAQYAAFLNSARSSGAISVNGTDVVGASENSTGQIYYSSAGLGYTDYGATNGGASRITYSGGTFTVVSGFENHPVTHVSWYGAQAFCDSYDFQLPTLEQWRAVADYDGTYRYGCGPAIDPTVANYRPSTHPDGTTAVGTFGEYGYGLADMAGNVIEWLSSEEPGVSYHKAFVGGTWYYDEYLCSLEWVNGASPDVCHALYGFRVVSNAQSLPTVNPVPLPGAALLGVLGLGVAGTRLRRDAY